MRTYEGARSSTSAVIVDNAGERLIIGERDHAMSMDSSWLPLERIAGAAAVLSDFRWVEATRDAFREARARGVPTLLDADLGGGGLLAEFLCLADYAIFSALALDEFAPGMDERAQLESVLAHRRPPCRRHPRGRRVRVAVEKRRGGTASPVFPPRSSTRRAPATPSTAPTPGRWPTDRPAADCARVAAAVAALKCRKLGARAGLPTRAELDEFLAARVD